MKKFLVTILALVYLTSTIGATVRLDCCLEKLVSTTFGTTTHEELWSEEKDCKDDHKQLRLGHEQKRNDAKIRVAKFVASAINIRFPEYPFHVVSTLTESYPVNNAPPQQAKIPLFILHCVHRI